MLLALAARLTVIVLATIFLQPLVLTLWIDRDTFLLISTLIIFLMLGYFYYVIATGIPL